MRLLIELLIVAALVTLTWQHSLQERMAILTGVKPELSATPAPTATPVVRYVTQPTATPSGDWMWDPARRSALDRPAYDPKEKSQRYLDAEGRRYWLDGNGVRHYDQ
jgi:hypothetical protein